MRAYIVQAGDYLHMLAWRDGYDADTVWADPKNAELKALRADMDRLRPGDLLYVPEPREAPLPLTVGAQNNFTAPPPPDGNPGEVVFRLVRVDGKTPAAGVIAVIKMPDGSTAEHAADGRGEVRLPAKPGESFRLAHIIDRADGHRLVTSLLEET